MKEIQQNLSSSSFSDSLRIPLHLSLLRLSCPFPSPLIMVFSPMNSVFTFITFYSTLTLITFPSSIPCHTTPMLSYYSPAFIQPPRIIALSLSLLFSLLLISNYKAIINRAGAIQKKTVVGTFCKMVVIKRKSG